MRDLLLEEDRDLYFAELRSGIRTPKETFKPPSFWQLLKMYTLSVLIAACVWLTFALINAPLLIFEPDSAIRYTEIGMGISALPGSAKLIWDVV